MGESMDSYCYGRVGKEVCSMNVGRNASEYTEKANPKTKQSNADNSQDIRTSKPS